ncbi:MAG: M1 family metallopeptidase [Steroidobacteraceae bacterium]|jgi:aminopeptidase N
MTRSSVAHLAIAAGAIGVLAGSAVLAAAGPDLAPIQSGLDYHSFANIEQFRVTRVELNLRVDFVNKVLFGVVALEVKRLDPTATQLVLDSRDLDIRDVSEKPSSVIGALSKSETTWVSRPFHVDRADPVLGSPLVIELPPLKKSTETIKIDYVTSPTAAALQWLTDKQTAGKHHPFMYTLSYPMGARSWIPLQDTPQVRASYSAVIHTDNDVLAVMSAKNDPKVKRNGEYSFVMQDPVPSCLIALAVGDLHFKETGPRTGVYSEKPLLDQAAKDFADTDTMLKSAERLFGPYRFDRYDVVVMPPSFPIVEVGNPAAPFVTPTAVTQDRSQESVVAQALAQVWAGGLVSVSSWRDAWINEGLSRYMRNRLMEELFGSNRAVADSWLTLRSLRDDLASQNAGDQVLAADLRGRDPGSVAREPAFEKAGLFFAYLDAKYGRERFDAFLRGYFDHFMFKSINTEQFLAYLKDNLLERFPGIVTREQALSWVTSTGLPADTPLPVSAAFDPVDAARSAWLSRKVPAKKIDTHGWETPQWLYFLSGMPPTLSRDQMADLDQAFAFNRSIDAQVAGGWFRLVIRNGYQPGYQRLEEYLESTGRSSLIVPLYAELLKTPAGATLAKRVYALAKPFYQSRTVAAVDAVVRPDAGSDDDE